MTGDFGGVWHYAVPGQSFVRVRDVTDPQRQARLGPFSDLALPISHRSMLAAHVPVLRRALLPIGLFDECELNFLPEAAAGEISTALALDRWRSDGELSAACGTVETAVSALTEPARLARKIASPAVMARPTYG